MTARHGCDGYAIDWKQNTSNGNSPFSYCLMSHIVTHCCCFN